MGASIWEALRAHTSGKEFVREPLHGHAHERTHVQLASHLLVELVLRVCLVQLHLVLVVLAELEERVLLIQLVAESVQLKKLSEKQLDGIAVLVNDLAHDDGVDLVAAHQVLIEVLAAHELDVVGLQLPQYVWHLKVFLDAAIIRLADIVAAVPRLKNQLRQRLIEVSVQVDLSFI